VCLGLRRGQVGFGGFDRCLLDGHLDLVRLFIKLHEQIAFLYAIVVVDQHPSYLSRDTRGGERHMSVHIGVICRNGVERAANVWRHPICGDRHPQDERAEQNRTLPTVLWPTDRAGFNLVGGRRLGWFFCSYRMPVDRFAGACVRNGLIEPGLVR
jgi:hypothetical protein